MTKRRGPNTNGKTVAEKLAFYSMPVTECGCRIWLGSLNDSGYGRLRVGSRTLMAHRSAWVEERGEIPEGLCVLHTCDVPSCIEVAHLFLGTNADNSSDMVRKGRSAPQHGQLNGYAKLTDAQASIIKAAVGRQYEIAATYNVCTATVSMIKRGKTWRHIRG